MPVLCSLLVLFFEIKLVSKTHFSLILPSLNLHYFIFNIVGSKNYSWLTRTFPIFPKLQDKFSFYQKTEDWRKNSMWNLWFPICISPCQAARHLRILINYPLIYHDQVIFSFIIILYSLSKNMISDTHWSLPARHLLILINYDLIYHDLMNYIYYS